MTSSKSRYLSFLSALVVVAVSVGMQALGAELVVNGDFEADTEDFIAWPGYVSNGGNPPDIPDWLGQGAGRGINPINDPDEPRGHAPFNNGENDTHFLLMQGTTTVEQDVSGFEVGQEYLLSLEYNARDCCGDFPQVEMMLGGEFIEDFPDPDLFVDAVVEPSNAEWWLYEMPFTADEETITLSITARPFDGGDATFIMDNISIMPLSAGPIPLAGDADLDKDFDQLDLVKVQVAAKYLTGEPATWGEGDWDASPDPNSSFDSPPVGDQLFNQRDIIAALAVDTYLKGPYAAVAKGGTAGDGQTSLRYDAGTGELSVDAPAGKELTSINITSAGSKFLGDKPAALDGAFDNFAADNVFKATFGGSFGSISFGNILPAAIPEDELSADLSAVGSLAGGGDLGDVDLIYVPEPSALILVVCGLLACCLRNRRRS